MSTQPEALRLADLLEHIRPPVAAELRRMHDLLGKANAIARIRAERIEVLQAEVKRLTEMERHHARINGELREELKQTAAAGREACADILMRLHERAGGVHNYFQFAANAVRERGQA